MIEAGPRQAIVERFCIPLGGLEAQEETFLFWSSRLLPGRQLHEITFVNNQGRPQKWICFVTRNAEGTWCLAGEANITSLKLWPWGDDLWVHFSGGKPDEFWLSGSLYQRERNIVRVRLIAKNGCILEDRVQDGQVLFLTNQKMLFPIQVEFYDHLSNVINTHSWDAFPNERLTEKREEILSPRGARGFSVQEREREKELMMEAEMGIGGSRDPEPSQPWMFGSPVGSGSLSWQWVTEHLSKARHYWIATTCPDGQPHSRPVWGIWLDDVFYFSTGSLAAQNLTASSAITVHLESGSKVVIIEGVAETVSERPLMELVVNLYNEKYHWNVDLNHLPGPFYAVRPKKVFGWSFEESEINPESTVLGNATRWRFE